MPCQSRSALRTQDLKPPKSHVPRNPITQGPGPLRTQVLSKSLAQDPGPENPCPGTQLMKPRSRVSGPRSSEPSPRNPSPQDTGPKTRDQFMTGPEPKPSRPRSGARPPLRTQVLSKGLAQDPGPENPCPRTQLKNPCPESGPGS